MQGELGAADLVAQLTEERDQLARALESRVVIEQAKGVLAERYGLPIPDAFLLLRQSARGAQMKIHLLAEAVVASRASPNAIVRGLARDSRWRAAAMRERTEATAERTRDLHAAHLEQIGRVARTTRSIVRVRAASRWDALDLGSRLASYRWYLVAPDDEHWDVVVELTHPANDVPSAIRHCIEQWVAARGLQPAVVHLGDTELRIP